MFLRENPTFRCRDWIAIVALYLTCWCCGNSMIHHNSTPSFPTKNISFGSKFGVHFDPPVKYQHDQQISYKDVLIYLEIVRSRFSTIILKSYSTSSFEQNTVEISIPSVVAQLNKLKNEFLADEQPATKVYLKYNVDAPNHKQNSSKSNFNTTFENTLHLADQSNEIYSGTVEHIIMKLDISRASAYEDLLEQTAIVENKRKGGNWKYKLGFELPLDHCGELAADWNTDKRKIFSHFDFIFIRIISNDDDMLVKDFYWCAQRKLEKCTRDLKKNQSHLEIATITWLLSEDATDVLWYWEQMNGWAERTGSTAFMMEAFDQPGKYPQFPILNSLGWWHVHHYDSNNQFANQSGSDSSKRFVSITEKLSLSVLGEFGNSQLAPSCGGNVKSVPPEDDVFQNSQCPNKFPTIQQALAQTTSDDPVNSPFKHNLFIVYFSPKFHRFELENELEEDELVPLLKLVQTQFSTLMTTVTPSYLNVDYTSTSKYIPTAVAKLNRLQLRESSLLPPEKCRNESNILRLFLTYDMGNLRQLHKDDIESRIIILDRLKELFDSTISKADEANAIFNNSVDYMALRVRDTGFVNILLEHLQYTAAKVSQSNNSYKLGIILNVRECGYSSKHVDPFAKYLLQFVSFVMFDAVIPFSGYLPREVDIEAVIVDEYQGKLEYCLRKMRTSYPNLEVMFSTMWPDTDLSGEINVTRLTWVWESMNQWALKTNTTVLMYEAFDNFARRNRETSYVTVGWWRHENTCTCVKNIKEYRFAKKRDLKDCAMTLLPGSAPLSGFASGRVTFYQWNLTESFKQPSEEMNGNTQSLFDRDRFVVYYDTLSDVDRISYFGNNDIADALVPVIYRRFSKIYLKPIQEGNMLYKDMYTFIPKAAANFNRLRKSTEVDSFTDRDILQVILSFDLFSLPLLKETEESNVRTSFDVVLQLAKETNAIYPNTVERLMLQYQDLNEANVNFVVNQLEHFHKKVEKNGCPYQIGIRLTSEDCQFSEEDLEDNYLFAVLSHVNATVFTHWTTQRDWKIGVGQSFKFVTEEFTRCKEIINNKFPAVAVELFTSWSDTDENEVQNYTALIDYWRNINKFATTSKTTVILSKAFDSMDVLTRHVHHTGWWTQVGQEDTKTSLQNGWEFGVFDEKYQLISSESRKLLREEDAIETASKATHHGTKMFSNRLLQILVVVFLLKIIEIID